MACGCLVSRNRQLLAHKTSRTTHGPSLPAVGICGPWRRKKLRRKVTSDPWNASTTLNQNNYIDSDLLPSMQPQQLSYVEQSYIHFHSTPSYNEFLIDSTTNADASARDSLILPNRAKVGVGVSPSSARDAANEYTLQRITPSERQRSYENAIEPWDPQYLPSAKLEPKSHLEAITAHSHKPEFYSEPSNISEVPPKPSILLPVSSAIGQNTSFLQERTVSGAGFGAGTSIAVSPDGMHTFLNKSVFEASTNEMQLELSPRGTGELRGTNRQRNINGVTLGRDADGPYPQTMAPNVTNHHQIPSPNYQRITPHRKNTMSPPSARTDMPSSEVVPHRGNSNNSDFYCRVRNVYVLPEFSYCISAPDDRLE
ncbi:unnamed protein product [Dibothriocephalus latus]|uniref:Uncharacterized protein n=1 Tax=Dibothriocephalus latus TaxID=60516 RepID=A0A3P6U7R4_DIBLA|nr:unnamed protein product [Dibothriocephalus latus]